MKKVLTVAGSDSGGGAGIQADLKTMTAIGVFGMTAVTALTAQNTLGVQGIYPVSAEFLNLQLEAVLDDLGADAAKTGMLFSGELVETAAAAFRRYDIGNLVVDPVMVSKSGHRLLEDEAVSALISEMLPLAEVVTPNLPEAEILAGIPVRTLGAMKEAARRIADLGPRWVVVKGGHLGEDSPDVLYREEAEVIPGERLSAGQVHGTGCTFSAALASYLALGLEVRDGVVRAKEFVTRAIAGAVSLGRGHPPANHLFGIPEGGIPG
jgi:hydroxymethylpyrimidine/phosphomethylpyrimidine kinase